MNGANLSLPEPIELVAIDPAGAGAIDVGGLDGRLNRFSVEGVRFAGALPSAHGPVSLDAIGQIAVKGAPFDVAEGDVRGGAIDLVLRSGSNTATGGADASSPRVGTSIACTTNMYRCGWSPRGGAAPS